MKPSIWIPVYHDIKAMMGRQKLALKMLTRMEKTMADLKTRFDNLNSRIEDIKADVKALREALDRADQLSPEAEAALASLEANVGTLDTEVGDADGSDQPETDEPSGEPGDNQPNV